MNSFDNSDDVIDSRAVIERIEELQDAYDEYKVLTALAEEAADSEDWPHGATLIRETYFVDYCKELLADIGDLPKDLPHYIEIDWDTTADNLRADYTEVDFDGVAYLIR